jgi:hypothetical protein
VKDEKCESPERHSGEGRNPVFSFHPDYCFQAEPRT